jgi:hypothetical protein
MTAREIATLEAYLEYAAYGGPEGIDAWHYDQGYTPDEDGEIAYEAMLDARASREQEIEDRMMGIW